MQADERKAAEEAEKRLKAALTAKREPSLVNGSRIGSPAVTEANTPADQGNDSTKQEGKAEDVVMDGTEATPQQVEVSRLVRVACVRMLSHF